MIHDLSQCAAAGNDPVRNTVDLLRHTCEWLSPELEPRIRRVTSSRLKVTAGCRSGTIADQITRVHVAPHAPSFSECGSIWRCTGGHLAVNRTCKRAATNVKPGRIRATLSFPHETGGGTLFGPGSRGVIRPRSPLRRAVLGSGRQDPAQRAALPSA